MADDRRPDVHPSGEPAEPLGDPLLAEDVMLLLFDPSSGTIAGEGTLFYVLGGAVLAELALGEQIVVEDRGALRGDLVQVAPGSGPGDPLLRDAWEQIESQPGGAQGVLAAIGPPLRGPVLDRLVARGDIARERRTKLGLFTTTTLRLGGSGRREELVGRARAVLVDGTAPDPRLAATVALLSASGSLPSLHREIPWTSPVITRAKELEQGSWGAETAGAAVLRTATAVAVNAAVAASVLPRG